MPTKIDINGENNSTHHAKSANECYVMSRVGKMGESPVFSAKPHEGSSENDVERSRWHVLQNN